MTVYAALRIGLSLKSGSSSLNTLCATALTSRPYVASSRGSRASSKLSQNLKLSVGISNRAIP